MLGREEYIANLRLSSTVRAQGCVIECGVWKGGTIAGMAEVLGADREYFLFDSFQGHRDPQPIDGPAALAWKEDKDGPWYFNNAVVGTEDAEGAMLSSGAKSFKLVKGWFEDTLLHFVPPSPIAVLRIDCDWYASAMTCFARSFSHISQMREFLSLMDIRTGTATLALFTSTWRASMELLASSNLRVVFTTL